MTDLTRPERPGIITFVGVVVYIQALLAGITGVLALLNRNDAGWQEATSQTADQLFVLGIAEIIVALVLALLANAIMMGMRGARTLVGLAMAVRIGVAAWTMLTHHSGGAFGTSAITIVIALFVLWIMYGDERSEAFFT